MDSVKSFKVYSVVYFNIRSVVRIYDEGFCEVYLSHDEYKCMESDMDVQIYLTNPSRRPLLRPQYQGDHIERGDNPVPKWMQKLVKERKTPTKQEWEALKIELKLLGL